MAERKEPSAKALAFVMERAQCKLPACSFECDCKNEACDLDDFTAQAVAAERARCVEILHDEGWLGRSEQWIAHPDPRDFTSIEALQTAKRTKPPASDLERASEVLGNGEHECGACGGTYPPIEGCGAARNAADARQPIPCRPRFREDAVQRVAFALATARLEAAAEMRERAARTIEAEATCGCEGRSGYCNTNDPPREHAALVRALPDAPPSEEK